MSIWLLCWFLLLTQLKFIFKKNIIAQLEQKVVLHEKYTHHCMLGGDGFKALFSPDFPVFVCHFNLQFWP